MLENPYACIFVISISWEIQLKALQISIRTAPTNSYKDFFQFSISLINTWFQGIIQEFNLGVGSHMSITLWCKLCRGGFAWCWKPLLEAPLFCCVSLICYIHYFAIYFILSNNNIFPKFIFHWSGSQPACSYQLAIYSFSFLKSNFVIFWA